MSRDKPINLAASVRQRLMNIARRDREDFNLVLTRYALERLLYRLARSPHRERFILKGAVLFQLWSGQRHRPTRDLDLLGHGDSSASHFEAVFRSICAQDVEDDGLTFLPDTVRAERIKDEDEYQGVRVRVDARLANARIPLQIDVGFGDVITPAPVAVEYPTLLDLPAPTVRAYPRETVVAEKFQAMVMLGIANSRMKDFYDLWILSRQFDFAGPVLMTAVAKTFANRRTQIVASPLALTPAFADDSAKRTQWQAVLKKSRLSNAPGALREVVDSLRTFLSPVAAALCESQSFDRVWRAPGPWRPR